MNRFHVDESQEYFFKEGCHILELLNTPEDETLSVARARVAPGVSTKLHRLHGLVERYVVLSGAGMVNIEGETAEVSAGSSVIIPAGHAQMITNTGQEDLVFFAICTPRFEPQFYEEVQL